MANNPVKDCYRIRRNHREGFFIRDTKEIRISPGKAYRLYLFMSWRRIWFIGYYPNNSCFFILVVQITRFGERDKKQICKYFCKWRFRLDCLPDIFKHWHDNGVITNNWCFFTIYELWRLITPRLFYGYRYLSCNI